METERRHQGNESEGKRRKRKEKRERREKGRRKEAVANLLYTERSIPAKSSWIERDRKKKKLTRADRNSGTDDGNSTLYYSTILPHITKQTYV